MTDQFPADPKQLPARRGTSGSLVEPLVTMIRLLMGAVVALFGFLLVLDLLSVRALLGETGPMPALQAAQLIHAVVEHPGAQVAELAIGLAGLTCVALSVRTLWRGAGQRRHST